MFIEAWLLITLLVVFGLITALLLSTLRKVRALRFCLYCTQEWTWNNLKEEHEYIRAKYGKESLVSFEQYSWKFKEHNKFVKSTLKRVGLSEPNESDKFFVLE